MLPPLHLAKNIRISRSGSVSGEASVDKWICKVCGYVYDPADGDPVAGVSPGTPFENLPEDWVCPACGAPKSEFEKIQE